MIGESDGGGVDELPFTPPARSPACGFEARAGQEQQPAAPSTTTTSATKHRKHLLSLSLPLLPVAPADSACAHCSTPATPALPLVFLLSFPLVDCACAASMRGVEAAGCGDGASEWVMGG